MLDQDPTRRQLLKAAIGGAAGFLLGAVPDRVAAQAPIYPEAERLADDIFVVRIPGEANVLAQTSSAGVLLVDGGSARSAGELMKAIGVRMKTGQGNESLRFELNSEQLG